MSEQMLRDALHDAMADSPAPPPMTSATVVRRARRVRARRRVAWSGAGCAAVVATMAVTASVLPGTGRTPAPVQVGASPRVTVPPPTGTPSPSGSPGAWPTGPDGKPQQDRTATAGVRYVQAVHLLDALSPAVPDGYRVAGHEVHDLRPDGYSSYGTDTARAVA